MSKKKESPVPAASPPKYRRETILTMRRYAHRRDLLGVLLEDGREYSHDEVHALLNNFEKGKVK